MKAALAQGVVAIGVQAGQTKFQQYAGGILTDCPGTRPDHGASIVGWNREGETDYYILRNMWGPRWGEQGYA